MQFNFRLNWVQIFSWLSSYSFSGSCPIWQMFGEEGTDTPSRVWTVHLITEAPMQLSMTLWFCVTVSFSPSSFYLWSFPKMLNSRRPLNRAFISKTGTWENWVIFKCSFVALHVYFSRPFSLFFIRLSLLFRLMLF